MQKRAMEFEKLALEKKKVWKDKYAVLPEAKTEEELVKALDGLTAYVLAERGLPVGIKKQASEARPTHFCVPFLVCIYICKYKKRLTILKNTIAHKRKHETTGAGQRYPQGEASGEGEQDLEQERGDLLRAAHLLHQL
jgi:hypothetical protein